jgi:hypothetical protein
MGISTGRNSLPEVNCGLLGTDSFLSTFVRFCAQEYAFRCGGRDE